MIDDEEREAIWQAATVPEIFHALADNIETAPDMTKVIDALSDVIDGWDDFHEDLARAVKARRGSGR